MKQRWQYNRKKKPIINKSDQLRYNKFMRNLKQFDIIWKQWRFYQLKWWKNQERIKIKPELWRYRIIKNNENQTSLNETQYHLSSIYASHHQRRILKQYCVEVERNIQTNQQPQLGKNWTKTKFLWKCLKNNNQKWKATKTTKV